MATIPGIITSNVKTNYYSKLNGISWMDIKQIIDSGNALKCFEVGDKKTSYIGQESVTFVVMGIYTYDAHVDFIMENCLKTKYEFDSSSRMFVYETSSLKDILNTNIYNEMEKELKSVISSKTMYDYAGKQYINYIWLPKYYEINGKNPVFISASGSSSVIQENNYYQRYPLFNLGNISTIKKIGNDGTTTDWWTASSRRENGNANSAVVPSINALGRRENGNANPAAAYSINALGKDTFIPVTNKLGVAPCFRI